MARFLIAFVDKRDSGLPMAPEAFKISQDCSPYDVTVPMKTIFFIFAQADTEDYKEFTESFVTLKMGAALVMNTSIPMIPENNGKRYWVGRLVNFNGNKVIFNENIHAVIPTFCLQDNDEIIDL